MSDTPAELLEEAEKLLAVATPGPWEVNVMHSGPIVTTDKHGTVAHPLTRADGFFIAASPRLVTSLSQALRETLEELRQTREREDWILNACSHMDPREAVNHIVSIFRDAALQDRSTEDDAPARENSDG